MSGSCWDPTQYERFKREREQPGLDLIALVRKKPGMRVVDLGCGTGELTKRLHEEIGAASTVGIDSSTTMLAKAPVAPGLRFEPGTIEEFGSKGEAVDLIFSNAAVHWVPGHEELFARLGAALAPGGQLAVQVPANFDHPSQAVSREVAGEEPFRSALGGFVWRLPVLKPEEYAGILHRLGFAQQSVRLQVYGHVLGNREEVYEWVKGTLLTVYEARLESPMRELFLASYRARLVAALADEKPYFFPYKRILIWGMKR